MTGRSVPEWIGATPDTPIPARVKLRIFQAQDGKCAITGVKLRPGHFQYDHTKALCNGGENREKNIQAIASEPHKAKTAADVDERAKTDRMARKHAGIDSGRPSRLSPPKDMKFNWSTQRYEKRGEQ